MVTCLSYASLLEITLFHVLPGLDLIGLPQEDESDDRVCATCCLSIKKICLNQHEADTISY